VSDLQMLLAEARAVCSRCGAEPGQPHRTADPPRAGAVVLCTGCGKPPPPRKPLYGAGGFRRRDGSWAVIAEPCEHLCPPCSAARCVELEAPTLETLNARVLYTLAAGGA
jgi:hypothetical protein